MQRLYDNEVLVKSVYCGICGTDREIHEGLYGTAPKGLDYLIMGHESFGVVEKVGKYVSAFEKGDYVVRSVRRSCDECVPCLNGANDMCTTGKSVESGIGGLHGCMAEYFKDTPEYLFQIPYELKEVAVLLEPLSVVEKAYRRAEEIQENIMWDPEKAMVIGAGSIGLLQAMILKELDIDIYVVARSKPGNLKSQLVEQIGATYVSTSETTLDELASEVGKFDYILEASGDSKMVFEAWEQLAANGILCMSSITGGKRKESIDVNKLVFDSVLGNKLLFGSVNSNRLDYTNGIRSLERFLQLSPDVLPAFFTRRLSIDQYEQALETVSGDIKTVLEIS